MLFRDDLKSRKLCRQREQYLDQGETLRSKIRRVAKVRSDEASQLPAFLKRHMND